MPSSAPSTTPVTSARRSPVVPSASARAIAVRSRSPTPPIPPRRPTTCQEPLALRTTWIPLRSSHPFSSKPVSGPRGATGRARSSSTAPWGGARPAGNCKSTRSLSAAPSKRRTSAVTRTANGERDGGPVTTTSAVAGSPSRPRRMLRSSSWRRRPPHHRPTAPSAAATSASRAGRGNPNEAATAKTSAAAPAGRAAEIQFAAPRPSASARSNTAGQPWSSDRRTTSTLMASPDPGVARFAQGRFPGSRRGRPRSGMTRASDASPGSSAP